MLEILPKYAVSTVVRFIKGRSVIQIARSCMGRKRNFSDSSFWVRGYFVSTVGRDEQMSEEYIKNFKKED